MSKRKAKRTMRAAVKAPSWLRDIAASKAVTKSGHNIRYRGSLGKFGAASPVRTIYSKGGETDN